MEKFLTRSGESPYSMYLCPILTLQFKIHRVMSILRQIQHYYSCCGLSSSYHVMSSSHVGFVFGKAKLAPHLQPTIPRLELCTAVLAELISNQMQSISTVTVRQFWATYSMRPDISLCKYITECSEFVKVQFQNFIPSNQNPADIATRSVSTSRLADMQWFTGPDFLHRPP